MFRGDSFKIYAVIGVALMFASAIATGFGEDGLADVLRLVGVLLILALAIASKYRKQLPPKEHQVNALHDRIAESVERAMDDERRR